MELPCELGVLADYRRVALVEQLENILKEKEHKQKKFKQIIGNFNKL
jgi:hypothetical protein